MAEMYTFLNQNIVMGELVGDICNLNSRLNYITSPSYFDPIQYMQENGGIPSSDHVYNFYSENTGDSNPVFAIYVTYSGNRFKVGYCMRSYDPDTSTWYSWSNIPIYMDYFDSYAGCDPHHVQPEDRWKNGLYFTNVTVSTFPNPSSYGVGAMGFVLGHEDYSTGHPVQNPVTSPYELNSATPPRYEYDNIETTYSMYDYHGYQIAFPRFGMEWALDLIAEIDGSTGDDSKPAGGGGDYDFPTFDIPYGDLPSISIIDTGIATMWTPALAEIQGLVNFMWSSSFFDNIIKNCDPIDNIIQLGIVPLNLSSYAGTAKEVKVGNVSTGVTMTPLTQQFIYYDMGRVQINEAWGAVLDYAPNTKISCYAPYVGTFDLTPDEVMNCKFLEMMYKIDLLTGDFVMMLLADKMMPFPMSRELKSVMYHKAGNLMVKMPITGANYSKMYSQILQGVAQGIGSAATGNLAGVAGAVAGVATSAYSVEVQRSGQYTGSGAILDCEYPHLILTQPIQVKPAKYGEYEGFATYITYQVKKMTKYMKCESIIDNTITGATEREKAEIERLLMEGIYLPASER